MESPEVQEFKKYCRDNQLKITQERLEILRFVQMMEGHFDADDLIIFMHQKGVRASRATIYRTLELLTKMGFLRREKLRERHFTYEYIVNRPPHEHIICKGCGKIVELTNKNLEKLIGQMTKKNKFSYDSHVLQIYGYCESCQKK